MAFDKDGNHRLIHELSAEDGALIAGYELIVKNATAGNGKTDEVWKVKLKEQVKFVEMAANSFCHTRTRRSSVLKTSAPK